jgi:general secretion pathway protein N
LQPSNDPAITTYSVVLAIAVLLGDEAIAEPGFSPLRDTPDRNAQNESNAPLDDPFGGGMRIPAGAGPVREFESQSATRRVEELRANPLWPIAVETLSATRERPIFLPSRRRPSPVLPPAAPSPPGPIGVPPVKPEYPRLTLLGSVAGQSEALAVFLDQGDRGIVRLRIGEHHRGWTLRSVQGREAILQRDRETVIFSLAAPAEGSTDPVNSPVVIYPAAPHIRGAPNRPGIAVSPTGTVPGRAPPR